MTKIYGYIRCSKDTIDAENQRFQISKKFEVDEWVEDEMTGNSNADDRTLGLIIEKLAAGDTLAVADVSRLGRRSLDVMETGARVMKKKAKLVAVENDIELKDDIGSEVMFFALSLGARIEREMISARTKAALAQRKAKGVKLGRPKGAKSINPKLAAHEADIRTMLENKVSKAAIARTFGVSRDTLRKFIRDKELA